MQYIDSKGHIHTSTKTMNVINYRNFVYGGYLEERNEYRCKICNDVLYIKEDELKD